MAKDNDSKKSTKDEEDNNRLNKVSLGLGALLGQISSNSPSPTQSPKKDYKPSPDYKNDNKKGSRFDQTSANINKFNQNERGNSAKHFNTPPPKIDSTNNKSNFENKSNKKNRFGQNENKGNNLQQDNNKTVNKDDKNNENNSMNKKNLGLGALLGNIQEDNNKLNKQNLGLGALLGQFNQKDNQSQPQNQGCIKPPKMNFCLAPPM